MGSQRGHARRFIAPVASCALVFAALLLLFAGQSRSAGPPAPGTWSLSNGTVTDTETNMSGQPIKVFFLVLPTGVTVTGGGTLTGVTPSDCSPKMPNGNPNEVECFMPNGWANGTSITFTFPVSDPEGKLTANPAPSFKKGISYDGSTYAAEFDLPPAAAPAPEPCKCVGLDGGLSHFHIFGAGTTKIEFNVDWELLCSPGQGGCNGEILDKAPQGARFLEQGGKKFPPKDKPSIVHVKCAGACSARTKGKTTLSYLALNTFKDKKGHTHTVPNPNFLPKGRANKTFLIKVSIICANPPGVVKVLKLRFDKHGQVDKKKSKVSF
jgi:hypothetical protein